MVDYNNFMFYARDDVMSYRVSSRGLAPTQHRLFCRLSTPVRIHNSISFCKRLVRNLVCFA